MLYLRRAFRRTKGAFWSAYYAVLYSLKYLHYKRLMQVFDIDEAYIRQAFQYLCELGISELKEVEGFPDKGRLMMFAHGNMLHLKHEVFTAPADVPEQEPTWNRLYEAVLNENGQGQLYLHVWSDIQREVKMEHGLIHKTNWHEHFRTGRTVDFKETHRFLWYLRKLYGDGPKNEDTASDPTQDTTDEA